MNIVIRCHDNLYKFGLIALLCEIFVQEREQQTLRFSDYHRDKIAVADIMILMLRPGEHYICHPELRDAAPGLIIGLVDREHLPVRSELPTCIKHIVFIPHDETVEQMSRLIKHRWLLTQQEKTLPKEYACLSCLHKTFTAQQYRMVSLFLSGLTSRQIAREMDIYPKTVLAHRNTLMNKFGLRTDCELLQFLTAVHEKAVVSRSM